MILSVKLLAQTQKTLGTFRITEATSNGIDKSQWYFERKQYFAFYTDLQGQLCLANVSGISDEQSYGKLFPISVHKEPETSETYEVAIFRFRWKYNNSYNKNAGYATVELTKVFRPNGVIFVLKMVLPNLDVDVYKGYMEGSVNLEDYF